MMRFRWTPLVGLPLAASLFCGLFLFLPAASSNAIDQKEQITVERDKDKTSYVIRGSEKDPAREERERAWEMLDRVIIDTRGSNGKGPHNNR